MQRHERLLLQHARDLVPNGQFELTQKGRHPCLKIVVERRTVTITVPCSPRSDDKCQLNFLRQNIRRALT